MTNERSAYDQYPAIFGDGRDGDIDLTTGTRLLATRDMYHRNIRGSRRDLFRYANNFRVFSQSWQELPDRNPAPNPNAQSPNPDARSLFEELANRIDGASLGPTSGGSLERDIEWRVWCKLSTMIRQVLRGPDLIEQPRLVEGQIPKHAFARAERNSGSQWNGPPEETCWFCGTDPRNSIHEIEAIPVENFYELVAIAFGVPRDIAKKKLVRALFVRPDLKQREDHAQNPTDRVRDDRDIKPDKG